MTRLAQSSVLAAVISLAATHATAQDSEPLARGIDPVVHKLTPAMNAHLTVEGADLAPAGSYQLALAADYNMGLLGFKVGGDRKGDLIEHRLDLHLWGAISATDWLELGLDLPVTPWQANGFDDLERETGFADTPPASGGLGDLGLFGRAGILSERDAPLGLAAVLEARGLTGDGDSFLGERGVVLFPHGVIEKTLGRVRLAGSLGYRYRTAPGQYLNLYVGDYWSGGVAAAFLLPDGESLRHALHAELLLSTSARAPFTFDSADALKTPFEALLGWRGEIDNRWVILAGVGRGVTTDGGYGREDLRVFASLGFRGSVADSGTNGDREGDRDRDGVLDIDDRCPEEPGPEELDGCPDRDSDGIPDVEDKCPDEPGPAKADGCPVTEDLVVYEGGKLTLFGAINFDTGKDTIQADSFPVLDEAVKVLNANPEIERIRVDGHTDSVGADAMNLDLSQRRARSVRRYLIDHGVAEGRLESEGFGETKPIAGNDTPLGRAKNRRVEFTVLKVAGASPAGEPPPAGEAPQPPPTE